MCGEPDHAICKIWTDQVTKKQKRVNLREINGSWWIHLEIILHTKIAKAILTIKQNKLLSCATQVLSTLLLTHSRMNW